MGTVMSVIVGVWRIIVEIFVFWRQVSRIPNIQGMYVVMSERTQQMQHLNTREASDDGQLN